MRRLGRPIVAIFAAYALLLAPVLGALAAGRMADQHFALCAASAADHGAPADSVKHELCCVLGACASAAPGLMPGVATAVASPRLGSAIVTALAAPFDRIPAPLAAPPRGPPTRA